MRRIFVFSAVLLSNIILSAALYFSPFERDLTDISEWVASFSDSVEFANIGYDDSFWKDENIVGFWKTGENGGNGIRWFRSKILISEYVGFTENLAISIPVAISAYEIYWDGLKIGESGQVGTDKNSEIVGNSARIFIIPGEHSSVGEHVLAIRISNFSTISGIVEEYPKIGFFTSIILSGSKTLSISFFLAGIFLVTALFNVIFIAKSLNVKAHVIYTMLSLCCCGHVLVPVFSNWFPINLQYYYSLALIADIFWVGILSFLPIYFYHIFNDKFTGIKSIVIIAVGTMTVVFSRLAIYDIAPILSVDTWGEINILVAVISIILSIVITFKASFQKKKGAKTILVGLILFAAGVSVSILLRYTNGWSTGFACLSVFITIVMGRYFWDEMRKKSAIEIKNARLELELLKGHIQPHFLLNSLNSIVAWIEEDPKIASKLVNELSKELRLLMAFAGRENVSLMEEVSLCKAHIEVMNLRKEKKINLEIDGNIDGIIIPPLILHTALENGITHGFIKKDTGTFYLKTEKSAKSITVLLENDGDNKITRNKKSSGTGNKYIIQRLSEVYGENFKFVSQPKDGGWQVVFEIPEGKK